MKPEEFAFVLTAGVVLVEKMRNTDYLTRVEELKKKIIQLEIEKSSKETTQIKEILTDEIQETMQNLLPSISKQIEILTGAALDKDRKHREEINQRVSTSEESVIKRVDDVGKNVDRINELLNRVERLEKGKHSHTLGADPVVSATKGASNEREMHKLISMTFANYGDFDIHPKRDYTGDHVFDWNGLRIIWEDKDYTRAVNKAEVDKAHRDLELNKDCHALLFISASSGIVGHCNSPGIDIEIFKGKAIVYVSFFKSAIDQQGYIRNIIQPILSGLKKSLLTNSLGTPRESAAIQFMVKNINPLIDSLNEQEKVCDTILNNNKIQLLSLRNAINRTKTSISKHLSTLLDPTVFNPIEETEENQTAPLLDTESIGSVSDDDTDCSDTDAPKKVENNDQPQKKRCCGSCGEAGHTRKTCPNKKAQQKCSVCGKEGHNARFHKK